MTDQPKDIKQRQAFAAAAKEFGITILKALLTVGAIFLVGIDEGYSHPDQPLPWAFAAAGVVCGVVIFLVCMPSRIWFIRAELWIGHHATPWIDKHFPRSKKLRPLNPIVLEEDEIESLDLIAWVMPCFLSLLLPGALFYLVVALSPDRLYSPFWLVGLVFGWLNTALLAAWNPVTLPQDAYELAKELFRLPVTIREAVKEMKEELKQRHASKLP